MSVFQIQLAGITCPTIPHQKWFWTDAILIKNHNHIVLLRQARAGFCGIAEKTESGRDDCLESNAAASVHFETGTRDHVRFVRTEKERSIGHVFRLTQAAPRNT